MTTTTRTVTDVRTLPPKERHSLIFRTFEGLAPGEAMELVNDHDPKPLLYQFQAERWGTFDWSPLEEGPEAWRIEIRKRGRDQVTDRAVFEYLAWDHDRLEEIYRGFQAHCRSGAWSEAAREFGEFRTGLERHIRMEEKVLFPAFERATNQPGDRGPTGVMLMEHEQIKRALLMIHEVVVMPAPKPTLDRVIKWETELLTVLSAHNEKEEGILYPWMDELSDTRKRDDLVKAMQSA